MRLWEWLKFRVERMTCHILGCDSDYYCCTRCGRGIYDYEFVECGLIQPILGLAYRIKSRFAKPPTCQECGSKKTRVAKHGCVFWECPNEGDGDHLPF